jgi:hypothetical protein
MKRDDLFIWIIVALLAAAIVITIIWAPRRTKHGYGSIDPREQATALPVGV